MTLISEKMSISQSFNTDLPIFVGIAGPAGSGKTSVGKGLVPPIQYLNSNNLPPLHLEHVWLAMPLYSMASIKTLTLGSDKTDRILFGLHEIVNDLMRNKIPFDDFIELIYDIYHIPCETEGKPRSFMQLAGDACRLRYEDCFSDYIKSKIFTEHRLIQQEYLKENQEPPTFIGIVSDIRRVNEAAMIKKQSNNRLIKLTATQEELNNRLMLRDGRIMNQAQANHNSETEIKDIPDEWFDAIIDTTNKTLEEVIEIVKETISS